MNFQRGRLIAFNGIDSAGKSTQIDLLLEELRKKGEKPVYLWTRGGYTGLFNFLKNSLRRIMGRRLPPSGRNDKRNQAFKKSWVRNLWLILAILDLILVYGIYVRISKSFGRIVIADRYLWDTWVDFRLNFSEVKFDQWILWKILKWITPKPSVAFLLLIPVEESLCRSKEKNEPFPDSEEMLRKRLNLYEKLSCLRNWNPLDCLKPIEEIQREIKSHIGL